jgi:hypothetical protein
MRRLLGLSLAAVLVVWIGARVAYFNGYYTEDAPGYVGDALAIAAGDYQARNHVNGLNLGTYGPVAIPLVLLGKTDAALSVWPLLCSLLGLLSMAGTATILFGPAWGVIAGLLYATYPGDVFFSTVVMPDAIQSGWLSFSLFLVTMASSRPALWRGDVLIFAAGVAMGVCHIVRANGALLVPIGVVAIIVLRSSSPALGWPATARRCGVFVEGVVVVFALEGLAYLATVGDFLFRFHVVDRHYGRMTSIEQFGLNTHPLTIPYSAFAPLTWWRFGAWGEFNPDQAYHGLLFTFALMALVLGGVALAAIPRTDCSRLMRGAALSAFWFTWPLLYHQFGSQSITQYIPIHRLSRHLVVYAPGAMLALVAGCALVWHATSRRTSRVALAVIGAIVLVVHVGFNLRAERIAYAGYHRIKDTYTRIRDHLPEDTHTIIADPGDLGFFDFWLNPLGTTRVQLHAFAQYPRCDSLVSGVVLTFSNPGWQGLSAPAIQETVARLPCLLQPPAEWQLLYEGDPERVYVIERNRVRP